MFALSSTIRFLYLLIISACLIQLIVPALADDDWDYYEDEEDFEVTLKKPHLHGSRRPKDLITFAVDLDSVFGENLEDHELSSEFHRRSKRSLRMDPRSLYCGGYTKKVCQLICGTKARKHFWCGARNCICFGQANRRQ